jgi:hypothetical protein
MLGMALFGPQPLRAVDPEFAHVVGIRRDVASPFPSDITRSRSGLGEYGDFGGGHR